MAVLTPKRTAFFLTRDARAFSLKNHCREARISKETFVRRTRRRRANANTEHVYFLRPIKERFTSDLHVKARGSMLIQSLSEIQTVIASNRPENGRLAGKDVVDDLGY